MSAVRSFLGAVWSYGISLPLYVMWSLIVSSVRATFDAFYPRGYRPCNELADAFVEECANRLAGQTVRLPWVDSSTTHSLVMSNTGRLLSYVAIASGWFGVAGKNSGNKYQPKRTYRYYYRRSLTGNWFAEIWSVPKSGFIAAALAIPFVDMARDVMKGRTYANGEFVALPGHEGLMLLMAGLLLVICFLPRAILGRGTHFAAVAPINGGAFGGYGCAQVINWAAAMGGLSYLWLAIGAEWNAAAAVSFASGFLSKLFGLNKFGVLLSQFDFFGAAYCILNGFLTMGVYVLFGLAWTVIPAAAFWYVSLRFIAARNAKTQLEALPFNSTQATMYLGSDFEKLAELRAPQVTLGYLVYIGVMVGIILYPIQAWVRSLF